MSVPAWSGVFSYGTLVTSSFLSWVKTWLERAVEGTEGGDYQPANKIRFGGAGISIYDTSSLDVENACELNMKLGSTLTCKTGSTFTIQSGCTVNIASAVNITTGTLTCQAISCTTVTASGLVTCNAGATVPSGQTLTVAGAASFSSTSSITVDSAVTPNFQGNVTIGGDVTISGDPKLSSRSTTRVVPLNGIADGPTNWEGDDNGNWTHNTATGGSVAFPLDLPDGSTITSLVIYFDPAAHGFLPATQPIFYFKRKSTTGTVTSIASVNDTTTLPAYDSAHTLTLSGLTEVVDNSTYMYYAYFDGEQGANAQAGTVITGLTVTATISRLPIGTPY